MCFCYGKKMEEREREIKLRGRKGEREGRERKLREKKRGRRIKMR